MKRSDGNIKIVLKNKRAFHDYHIVDRYEAGIALTGTEIKSIRDNKINLNDAYCKIQRNGELFAVNINISPYEKGGYINHEPLRKRKLLMHRREIHRLRSKLVERGFTLIPLMVYFKRGFAKLELGLAKGKTKYDKRQTLRKKEANKEISKYK